MVIWRKYQIFAIIRDMLLVLYVVLTWNGATLPSAKLFTEREWSCQVWFRLIKIHLLHLKGA